MISYQRRACYVQARLSPCGQVNALLYYWPHGVLPRRLSFCVEIRRSREIMIVARLLGGVLVEDKTLVCRDCGGEFTFTAGEQEFYQQRGLLHEPARCPNCRSERRRSRMGFDGGPRQMYPAVCASCGKDTEVPFQPRQGRPVYCSDCFASQRGS